jgi:hypothetical protein
MYRRTNRCNAFVLTSMMLLGLAIAAFPQGSLAQSNPLIGTWKLNLDKSKLAGPPGQRSSILTYTQDGQNVRAMDQLTDAQGNPATVVMMHIYDGMAHPSTGLSLYDASAYTRVDAKTVIVSRFKSGKLIGIGTLAVSQDGRTLTNPEKGIRANGDPYDVILVYDKQ